MNIAAVVVTYNRKALLEQCLRSLLNQSTQLTRIIVVDNASTDETPEYLQELALKNPDVEYLRLTENTGGSGGFYNGLKLSYEQGYEWSWIMDDDALPHQNALEELLKVVNSDSDIYGSIAVNGNATSWLTTLELGPKKNKSTNDINDIPVSANVAFLPFLGLLISKTVIKDIGLPEENYFIAADDVEYCLRAKKAGAHIIVAGRSQITHPKSELYNASLFFFNFNCLKLSPWKRYYDTRNRLLIARKYYGIALFTKTLPGTLVRVMLTLIHEDLKFAQLYASIAGIIDGLLNIKGKRHTWWRIPQ